MLFATTLNGFQMLSHKDFHLRCSKVPGGFCEREWILWIDNVESHCKSLILILRKQNTQNEHIIAHFEYFFTFHYSKTVWLAENLNEIKITHYEKIFSHIKQKFSHFEKGLGINNIFVVSLRLPLFSLRHITLKRNQKIISKICYYLT